MPREPKAGHQAVELLWQAERAGVRDGSPKGRDTVSVHDSPSPKGHAQRHVDKREVKTKLRGFSMGMTDDDDTVYCDVQMPLAQGRELLLLVTTLRESKAHPTLNRVFERIEDELSTSIDIIKNSPSWGPWCQ